MTKHDEWVPFSWHCPNCGALVTGYKNAQGTIKLECERCRVVMVRSFKGRSLLLCKKDGGKPTWLSIRNLRIFDFHLNSKIQIQGDYDNDKSRE